MWVSENAGVAGAWIKLIFAHSYPLAWCRLMQREHTNTAIRDIQMIFDSGVSMNVSMDHALGCISYSGGGGGGTAADDCDTFVDNEVQTPVCIS